MRSTGTGIAGLILGAMAVSWLRRCGSCEDRQADRGGRAAARRHPRSRVTKEYFVPEVDKRIAASG